MVDGQTQHAAACESLALQLIAREEWSDKKYKGLTRSFAAVSVALAYDIVGSHWSQQSRQAVRQHSTK